MKARVKATGEIKEVARGIYSPYQFVDDEGTIYTENDVEELPGDDGAIFFDPTIDYWTRLEHQYAGMVMQGMLSNEYTHKLYLDNKNYPNGLLNDSIKIATALIQKLKEKEERK